MFVPEIYLRGAVLIALLTTVALNVLACLDRQMLRRMFGIFCVTVARMVVVGAQKHK